MLIFKDVKILNDGAVAMETAEWFFKMLAVEFYRLLCSLPFFAFLKALKMETSADTCMQLFIAALSSIFKSRK